jgi:hypothetical protein
MPFALPFVRTSTRHVDVLCSRHVCTQWVSECQSGRQPQPMSLPYLQTQLLTASEDTALRLTHNQELEVDVSVEEGACAEMPAVAARVHCTV